MDHARLCFSLMLLLLPCLPACLPAACSDSSTPSSMHPSPSNNLLVPAGGGSSGLSPRPAPHEQQEQLTASTPGTPMQGLDGDMPTAQGPPHLAPSLITCASTMHETSFDAVAEALEAAIAANQIGGGVRVSQLDDVPEEALDSPRSEARCNSPFQTMQK